jgi:ParB-like chromosome segregation protein Spo0J
MNRFVGSTVEVPDQVRDQPVATVHWLHRSRLHANNWNPNLAAPPERRLLKISLCETGWTQPLVAYEDGADDQGPLYEIVDGYHRWMTSEDREVYAMTDGLVPVVLLTQTDPALLRMATIRQNRARGTHHVLKMADIVAELLEMGKSPEEIGRRLQMDEEEVERLADRGQMTKRGAAAAFGNGWTV